MNQVWERITAVRSLGAGYLWVSLAHTQLISQNNLIWYAINEQEYVRADQLSIFTPSTFQGVELTGTPERAFAWMVFDMWASTEPGVPATAGAPLFKRYTRVPIFEEQLVGDRFWYRVGPDQWLEQGKCLIPPPSHGSPSDGGTPLGQVRRRSQNHVESGTGESLAKILSNPAGQVFVADRPKGTRSWKSRTKVVYQSRT